MWRYVWLCRDVAVCMFTQGFVAVSFISSMGGASDRDSELSVVLSFVATQLTPILPVDALQ